jgi:hypothetical protein
MKLLLALLLATRAFAVGSYPDAATYGLMFTTSDATTDSSGGGYTATTSGTLATQQNMRPLFCGTAYSTGPFSHSNYSTMPAGFRTDFSSKTTWSVQMWINPIAFDNTTNFVLQLDAVTQYSLDINTNGSIRMVWNNNGLSSASGIVSLGKWQHIAIQGTSTEASIWYNFVKVTATSTVSGTPVISKSRLGDYDAAGGLYFNGYIYGVEFSSTAYGAYPTIATCGSQLSPYLKNSNRPWITPPKMLWLFFLPKELEALGSSTMGEQQLFKYFWSRDEKLAADKKFQADVAAKLIVTATPTVTPALKPSFTPTPSATATPAGK